MPKEEEEKSTSFSTKPNQTVMTGALQQQGQRHLLVRQSTLQFLMHRRCCLLTQNARRKEEKKEKKKQTASLSRKPDSNDIFTSAATTMALTYSLIKQSTLQVFRLLLARHSQTLRIHSNTESTFSFLFVFFFFFFFLSVYKNV